MRFFIYVLSLRHAGSSGPVSLVAYISDTDFAPGQYQPKDLSRFLHEALHEALHNLPHGSEQLIKMKWSLLRRDAIDGTPVETEYWKPFTLREIEDYFCLDRFQVRRAIAKTSITLRQMPDKALAAYPYHGQILPEDSSVRTRSNFPRAEE